MWGIMPLEFYDEYLDDEKISCKNGAYQGKAVFEGENYADKMIADERRWRENVRRGLADLERMKGIILDAKKYGHKYKMKMLQEDFINKKEKLKELILSRDYEWR